jgi:hypothetical protein
MRRGAAVQPWHQALRSACPAHCPPNPAPERHAAMRHRRPGSAAPALLSASGRLRAHTAAPSAGSHCTRTPPDSTCAASQSSCSTAPAFACSKKKNLKSPTTACQHAMAARPARQRGRAQRSFFFSAFSRAFSAAMAAFSSFRRAFSFTRSSSVSGSRSSGPSCRAPRTPLPSGFPSGPARRLGHRAHPALMCSPARCKHGTVISHALRRCSCERSLQRAQPNRRRQAPPRVQVPSAPGRSRHGAPEADAGRLRRSPRHAPRLHQGP